MESVEYRKVSDASDMSSETTPLLWSAPKTNVIKAPKVSPRTDVHADFCALVGVPASNKPNTNRQWPRSSLYGRATRQLSYQSMTYNFTASLNNTMLLSQVVLGAAVTALGASASSHLLITIIGALNTVIAGLVAYLKSRGQPMRARMYREDLERVVDEIENAEVMFLGISMGISGYDDVIEEYDVTVRSEVARLTRLYDRAVENNTRNNPDTYVAGPGSDAVAAGVGRAKLQVSAPTPAQTQVSTDAAPTSTTAPVVAATPVTDSNPDSSPASAPPKKADDAAVQAPVATPVVAATPTTDSKADQSPASAPPKKVEDAPAQTPAAAPVVAATPTTDSDPDSSPASAPPRKAKPPKSADSTALVNGTADAAGKGASVNGTADDKTRLDDSNSSKKPQSDDTDKSATQAGQQEQQAKNKDMKQDKGVTDLSGAADAEPAIVAPSTVQPATPSCPASHPSTDPNHDVADKSEKST